jgi:hypothetical protein
MARASQASGRSQRPPHAKQRAAFTELLLENPNYFGNFPQSGFEPVLVLEANTAYEQLSCVGYSPERDELEATVQIKLPGGYGGDLCSAGSNEYVRFETAALGDGVWDLWLEMVDASLTPIGSTALHRIQLDNTRPEADVAISSGGDCKDFVQGNPITGTLSASDLHFGHFDLYTLPASLSPPNPSTTRPSAAPAPDPATWTLATAGLKPCGYVIRLDVYDRTIVGSAPGSHNGRSDDTGLCLRKAA